MILIATHYERLGVRPDADPTQIRDAYRRLARVHHPDARGGRASVEMPAINEAYRVLSDPARRLDYDRQLRAGPSSTIGSARPTSSAPPRYAEPRMNPVGRYSEPPRFPWRFVVGLVLCGATAILVIGAFTNPSPPPPVDNVLRAGDCVVIEPTTRMASEVGCDAPHDGVVEELIPIDSRCPAGVETYLDRQGMGQACVRRP